MEEAPWPPSGKTSNLSLFMTGVGADDSHNSLATNDLTTLTQPLY